MFCCVYSEGIKNSLKYLMLDFSLSFLGHIGESLHEMKRD